MKLSLAVSVLICALLGFSKAYADGIPMNKDNRFTTGDRYVLNLTADQIKNLESQRNGENRLYGVKLDLTECQVAFLKEKTNMKVTELSVFEGLWSDCGCCAWSIASRFKPDRVEVSTDHLMETADTKKMLKQMRPKKWWEFWRKY